MKNIVKMLSISIVALFSLIMTTNAAVKETDNYNKNTIIIGFSRFTAGKAITAELAAKAGQIYERTYEFLFHEEADDIKIYVKNAADGEWYNTKTGKPLDKETKKELVENLYIFSVDGVEKTFEVPFGEPVDEGTLPRYITHNNGKLTVPASRLWFNFKSNGNMVYFNVKYDYNEDLDKEEMVFGEFNYHIEEIPDPPVDLAEIMVSQADEIVKKYYNIKSSYNYVDEEIIDEYYVNVGKYEGEEDFETIMIDGFYYYKGDTGILSVGKNSFIKAPIWKIDGDNNVLIALPWLASNSLPNGSTHIALCNLNEMGPECKTVSDVITYTDVSSNILRVAEVNPLFTVNGYKNEVTLDVQPQQTANIFNLSGHGHHGFGIIIKDAQNNAILDENQIIFRKDYNNPTSMAITFPEYNNTYVNIPKWQNGEFTKYYYKDMYYRLAMPGKGVVDVNISFTTEPSPLNLKNTMVEQSKTIVETYYEKATSTTYTEVIDDYYVNIGKYELDSMPTTLSLNGQTYNYSIDDIGSLSVGKNSFIKVPIWKIDAENNVLVALPYLASDTLPNGTTNIYVHNGNEGENFQVITYNDCSASTLELVDAKTLFTRSGYTNQIDYNTEYGSNVVNYTSGHGHHAYGLIIGERISDTEINNIIDKEQIIFRKSDDGSMGITFPETLSENVYTYATYPNYQNGAYTENNYTSYNYKLAMPGKGVIDITFNFEKVINSVE